MEQLENGTFNAPQIKKLMKDENFSVSMNLDELDAWFAFVEIVENSFGNHEAENYKKFVRNMLEKFKHLEVNMSMVIHFLLSHLNQI